MNIASPVASEVESVEFTFLSPKEIKAISVKRIENESTFDNLLNPVPGGLYDPALGSWGDSPCTTCNLNQATCPGHPGHIQLPVPVYHPVFMDMIYRLLRATCVYCKGFRLAAKDLHKYTCKLRLLQYGLINEAHIVGSIGETDLNLDFEKDLGLQSEAEEEGGKQSIDNITRARDKYVQQCLKASGASRRGDFTKGKHEGAIELRREIIREFLAEITTKRLCNNCGGISPSYRKNGFVKIFERSLSGKEKVKMAQKGFKKWGDALTRVYQQQSKRRQQVDEAIADVEADVMDVDIPEQDPEAAPIDKLEPLERYISSMEVRARLSELFDKEQELLALVYNAKPLTRSSPAITPDMFFMETILVPPNRFRPEARTGASEIAEAQQNSLYKGILKSCSKIALIHTALGEARADIMQ